MEEEKEKEGDANGGIWRSGRPQQKEKCELWDECKYSGQTCQLNDAILID